MLAEISLRNRRISVRSEGLNYSQELLSITQQEVSAEYSGFAHVQTSNTDARLALFESVRRLS